jgi:hypothetical protein
MNRMEHTRFSWIPDMNFGFARKCIRSRWSYQILIIGILTGCSPALVAECSDPLQNYLSYYGLSTESKILKTDVSLSDESAFSLAAMESCGSRGCEYALYSQVHGCATRVFDFTGTFRVLKKSSNGLKDIEVSNHDTYLSKKIVKQYCYNGYEYTVCDSA